MYQFVRFYKFSSKTVSLPYCLFLLTHHCDNNVEVARLSSRQAINDLLNILLALFFFFPFFDLHAIAGPQYYSSTIVWQCSGR